MALKNTIGPGFTAVAGLASITLDGVALGFRNAGLYVDEASGPRGWHVDMTDVPPELSAGRTYRAVFVDVDGDVYRGKVIPREVPIKKPDAVRLLGTGILQSGRADG